MNSLNNLIDRIKNDSNIREVYKNKLKEKCNLSDEQIEKIINHTINKGRFIDEEFAHYASDHNVKWNDANFFISDKINALSNCCRLISNMDEISSKNSKNGKLTGFINSIGGTELSIGSVKVNTINLLHIVHEIMGDVDEDSETPVKLSEQKYLAILKKRTKLCCKVLKTIRHIIQRNVEKGLLPNYCEGGVDIDKQYCTIGILGTYEVIKEFGYVETDEFGNEYYTDKGIEFARKILGVINEVKDTFDDEISYNIESIPAERAAIVLAEKDNLIFNLPEDKQRNILSNQWIALTSQCTMKEKLRVASILDNLCGGGCISHINISSTFPNTDSAWDALNVIAKAGVIYSCFNIKINMCKEGHGFVGTDTCPTCGGEVHTTAQRIVGYLVPTTSYSKERKAEFHKRNWFDVLSFSQE